MKKIIALVLIIAAFAGGYILAPGKVKTVQVITVDKKRITELENENTDLRNEIYARMVLGDSIVNQAHTMIKQNGELHYDIYVDGRRQGSTYAPISDNWNEWHVIRGMADTKVELDNRYDFQRDVEIRVVIEQGT